MIYSHYSQAPWDAARWPNFSPEELACRGSGEYYHDPDSFDALQRLRDALGAPVRINSGHRSVEHNAKVGGAPNSEHLRFAADVALDDHGRARLLASALVAGFRSFGLYETFVHMDRRPGRLWFWTSATRRLWQDL